VDLVDQTIDRVRRALATGTVREIDFREAMELGRTEWAARRAARVSDPPLNGVGLSG
jgi:hypothetical protein